MAGQSPHLERLVRSIYERYSAALLAISAALTVFAVWQASGLRLDSDLTGLLPETSPSVAGLLTLEESYAKGLDRFGFVLSSPDQANNEAAVDALKAYLQGLEVVDDVEAYRPTDFIEANRLLYMDLEDVEELSEIIGRRLRWEIRRANPMFVDVGRGGPPEVDLSEIEAKYEAQAMKRYLSNEANTHYALYADVKFATTDFDETRALIATVQNHFDTHLTTVYPSMELFFGGRYVKRYEQRGAIVTDLGRATALALALIAVFLALYFRNLAYPIVVTIPLVMGSMWAFGFFYIAFGTLNILTGFLGAVLLGLGIDFGIHLAARFREARDHGAEPEAAVVEALSGAGVAGIYAALTTIVALASLAVSSFRAFYEFGILAVGGLILILLAYILILPCLLLWMSRSRFEPAAASSSRLRGLGNLPQAVASQGFRRASVAILVVAVVVASFGMPKLGFEFDFNRLMPAQLPSFLIDEVLDEIVGASQQPGVVLVEDDAHARAVADELMRRKDEHEHGSLIERALVVMDLVPKDQEAKLEELEKLRRLFDRIPEGQRQEDEELSSFYDELVRVTEKGELSKDDLPRGFRERFARTDDPQKTVVLIVPSERIFDAKVALRYSEATSGLPDAEGNPTLDAITEEHLLRDILLHIEHDVVWMVIITLVGLLIVVAVAMRRPRRIAIALGSIVVGIFVSVGLVGVLGITFNFMNMIIWPIWLGLGVDATFHLTRRLELDNGAAQSFVETVGAVFAAFATTMIGFGCLMLSSGPGLVSLGQIAVLGLGSIFIVSVAILAHFVARGQ
jgi:uncharacterized protein